MHEIPMQQPSDEFRRCWLAAVKYIGRQAQGPIAWLKVEPVPPFLEHFSFRLGNQLFFVRVEDVDGRLEIPGNPNGTLSIARGCNGNACIMPMVLRRGAWSPDAAGWGLISARTRDPLDPVAMISDEEIEMTDWELREFAVQVVRDILKKDGRRIVSQQGNPTVDPSIWFVGDKGPEWVVVRTARYPAREAEAPDNWAEIAKQCARLSTKGHFASVAFANADDAFDGKTPPEPLWRGHGMHVNFEGLRPAPKAA